MKLITFLLKLCVVLIICVLMTTYFGLTIILMHCRRNTSPVKEHNVNMITVSGIGGWILVATELCVRGYSDLFQDVPCFYMYWVSVIFFPIYGFPYLLHVRILYVNV